MEDDELVEQYLRQQYVAHKARLDAMFEERPSFTVRQLDRDLEMTNAMLRLFDDDSDVVDEQPERCRIEAEVGALEALLHNESDAMPVVRPSPIVEERMYPPCPSWCVQDHADDRDGAQCRFCTTDPLTAIGGYGLGPEQISILVERYIGEEVQCYSICVRGSESNIELTVDEARKLAAALLESATLLDATT